MLAPFVREGSRYKASPYVALFCRDAQKVKVNDCAMLFFERVGFVRVCVRNKEKDVKEENVPKEQVSNHLHVS